MKTVALLFNYELDGALLVRFYLVIAEGTLQVTVVSENAVVSGARNGYRVLSRVFVSELQFGSEALSLVTLKGDFHPDFLPRDV